MILKYFRRNQQLGELSILEAVGRCFSTYLLNVLMQKPKVFADIAIKSVTYCADCGEFDQE
jgi:hypothetical protein